MGCFILASKNRALDILNPTLYLPQTSHRVVHYLQTSDPPIAHCLSLPTLGHRKASGAENRVGHPGEGRASWASQTALNPFPHGSKTPPKTPT